MYLSYTISSGTPTISGYGITNVVLNPANISVVPGLITQIKYVWPDETIVKNRRLELTGLNISTFTYQGDLGDPRNFIINKTLYPSAQHVQITPVEVWVLYATQASPTKVATIYINVYQAPVINTGANNGYAAKVHLVANRMWGNNDQKMFALETVDPLNVYIVTPET